MKIDNKQKMYRLLMSGALGRTVPMFETPLDAIRKSNWGDTYHIRFRHKTPGITMFYPLTRREMLGTYDTLLYRGFRPEEMIVGINSVNENDRVMNAEFDGMTLYHSTAPGTLIPSLRAGGRHSVGAAARLVMQAALTPASYDEIMWLSEEYPDHVIEFTTFRSSEQGFNHIIWEVRCY